jgi:hypothetical protein
MSNFKILSIFLALGPQNSYPKCRQMCPTVKFALPNSKILPFLVEICMGGTLRMSNIKILSIFQVFGPRNSYQKLQQICSRVKFA